MRRTRLVLPLIAIVLLLGACAAGANTEASRTADAGFWLGLWHGVISPITFIISLFKDSVSIYEVRNNGNWYDFGFILGVSMAFGGSASGGVAGRRRASR